MNKFYVLLIIVVLSIGCKKDVGSDTFNPAHTNRIAEKPISSRKGLSQYMDCDNDVFWTARQSDTASYWVRLVFKQDFAIYQVHGQCLHYYFTNYYHTGTDKIELLWSYKSDCLLNMDFMSQTHNIKKVPKHGDAFSEYQLLNDSVITVKYNFPEWTNEVNKIAKDSIFPKYFYLENESK